MRRRSAIYCVQIVSQSANRRSLGSSTPSRAKAALVGDPGFARDDNFESVLKSTFGMTKLEVAADAVC